MHVGKPQQKYAVEFDINNVVVDAKLVKDEAGCDGQNIFTLVRVFITSANVLQSSSNKFPVLDSSSQLMQYTVIQYLFRGGTEVPVVLPPNGNGKHQRTCYH